MAMSALSCLWDDPDRCPQVRVDGFTGRRYCRLCGPESAEAAEARLRAEAAAADPVSPAPVPGSPE